MKLPLRNVYSFLFYVLASATASANMQSISIFAKWKYMVQYFRISWVFRKSNSLEYKHLLPYISIQVLSLDWLIVLI